MYQRALLLPLLQHAAIISPQHAQLLRLRHAAIDAPQQILIRNLPLGQQERFPARRAEKITRGGVAEVDFLTTLGAEDDHVGEVPGVVQLSLGFVTRVFAEHAAGGAEDGAGGVDD